MVMGYCRIICSFPASDMSSVQISHFSILMQWRMVSAQGWAILGFFISRYDISKLLRYEQLTTIFAWDPLKYALMIYDSDLKFYKQCKLHTNVYVSKCKVNEKLLVKNQQQHVNLLLKSKRSVSLLTHSRVVA